MANGRFDNFSFEGGKAGTNSENLPGIENANISFDMGPDGGQLKANIEKGAINIHRIFEEPRIPLNKMQASVKWLSSKGKLTIPEWQLSLSNADLAGGVAWQLAP